MGIIIEIGDAIFTKYRLGKYYLPRNIQKKWLLKPHSIQGHKMYLDTTDSLGLSSSEFHENFETQLVRNLIKKGDTVLDIGANIGYYTLIFAKLVGREGKVFAFEPDLENFNLLKKNVKINGYRNIILVNKAVSNKNGKEKLYISIYNKGDHRIFDVNDGRKYIEIETIKLDDYFKNYNGNIDFIKIDVQGAEGGVIEGMLNLLEKNRDLKILSEFVPSLSTLFGFKPKEFFNMLLKNGFKPNYIDEKRQKIFPIIVDDWIKKGFFDKINYVNILFKK
ncbi:MAG: FkbM family methyltransferase [Promethearchaeota archaeon]